jgi:hypothetical protein
MRKGTRRFRKSKKKSAKVVHMKMRDERKQVA